jgi:hypothetical protein
MKKDLENRNLILVAVVGFVLSYLFFRTTHQTTIEGLNSGDFSYKGCYANRDGARLFPLWAGGKYFLQGPRGLGDAAFFLPDSLQHTVWKAQNKTNGGDPTTGAITAQQCYNMAKNVSAGGVTAFGVDYDVECWYTTDPAVFTTSGLGAKIQPGQQITCATSVNPTNGSGAGIAKVYTVNAKDPAQVAAAAAAAAAASILAQDGGTFRLTEDKYAKYGYNNSWSDTKLLRGGYSYTCNSALFGSDPLPGSTAKVCIVDPRGASAVTGQTYAPPPPPPSTSTPNSAATPSTSTPNSVAATPSTSTPTSAAATPSTSTSSTTGDAGFSLDRETQTYIGLGVGAVVLGLIVFAVIRSQQS